MKIKADVEVNSFVVPDSLSVRPKPGRRDDGFMTPQLIPLSELEAAVLADLCDEFRREVFRIAGKEDPQ